jgi:hypothetical protein
MIYALTPLRTGEAWVAGSCGLRARLTASGFVDLSAPTRKVHKQVGPLRLDCDGSASYRTVAASSAADAYFAGETVCGLDPNGIWSRPIEHFDGQHFRDLPRATAFREPHERSPDVMLLGTDTAYVLALGDDWHGSPHCAVYELKRDQLTLLRACVVSGYDRPGPSEQFLSMGLDRAGELWVAARRFAADAADSPGIPLLLHWVGRQWREEGPPDSGVLTQDEDGNLWLFGERVWWLSPNGWQERPMRLPPGASDFAVVNADDIWIAAGDGVVHLTGSAATKVPFDPQPSNASVAHIRAVEGHIWASGPFSVWQLLRTDEPVPAVWEPR